MVLIVTMIGPRAESIALIDVMWRRSSAGAMHQIPKLLHSLTKVHAVCHDAKDLSYLNTDYWYSVLPKRLKPHSWRRPSKEAIGQAFSPSKCAAA